MTADLVLAQLGVRGLILEPIQLQEASMGKRTYAKAFYHNRLIFFLNPALFE